MVNKLKIIRIINDNKEDKFIRYHIVKVTLFKKGYGKSNVCLLLDIINHLPKSLKIVLIFRILTFL
jgi:hypothetical protein